MTARDLASTLDDHPLTTLQAMQATMGENLRRARAARQTERAEAINRDIGIIQAEVIQRTCRLPHRAGMAWTSADDARLQRLARAGETIECIASTLGRAVPSITWRARYLGIEFGDDGRAVSQPLFELDGGARLSLAELLTARTIDDTLATWAHSARVGDVYAPASVRCERVS